MHAIVGCNLVIKDPFFGDEKEYLVKSKVLCKEMMHSIIIFLKKTETLTNKYLGSFKITLYILVA